MFKFRSIQFLIIVLVSVLFLSLCGSCSEGFTNSSSILNMQLNSINKSLSDYKTRPIPLGSPPGSKEFIDKNIIYLETFANNLDSLVKELYDTKDITITPSIKIDELIAKYKPPAGTTITKMTPDIGVSMAIGFDLGGIKQLASEVPISIFDKYINYRIDLMNGLFSSSNIDEMLNLASKEPSIVAYKDTIKRMIIDYLVEFELLLNVPRSVTVPAVTVPTVTVPTVTVPAVTRTEIPVFQQSSDGSSGWFGSYMPSIF